MRNKALAVYGTKSRTMTTRELSEHLNTTKDVILANAKKCLPNKVIEHGKATFWNEAEVTVILDYMKNHTSNNRSVELKSTVANSSTNLTPALKIKRALELMQEGYEEELERIKAEKEALAIKLDESGDWYSIKRMQKLNPDVDFNWRIMKRESEKLGYEVKKVFDQNYGEVNAYHRDVYEALYFDTLEY